MGCTLSSEFVVDDSVFGRSQLSADFMYDMGLSKQHVDILFTAFSDIDANNSYTVRMDEVTGYFNVDKIKYVRVIFGQFENEKSGCLNFLEFTASIWNFLSIDECLLGDLTFELHENKVGNMLQASDVVAVIDSICSGVTDTKKKTIISDIMARLRAKPDVFSLVAYKEFLSTNKIILGPLVSAQQTLRSQIIGEAFWSHQKELRAGQVGIGTLGQQSILAYIGSMRKKIDVIRKEEMRNLYRKKQHNDQEMQRMASMKREKSMMKILNDQLLKKTKRRRKKKKQVTDFDAINENTTGESDRPDSNEPPSRPPSLPNSPGNAATDVALTDIMELPSSSRKRKSSMLLLKKPSLLQNSAPLAKEKSVFGKPLFQSASSRKRNKPSAKKAAGNYKVMPRHTQCSESGVASSGESSLGTLPEGWVKQCDNDGEVFYANEVTGEMTWQPPT